MKQIMVPISVWQGDGIHCMKSSSTLKCKKFMADRKELYLDSDQTEKKSLTTTQRSIACANAVANFISLSDLRITLTKRMMQKISQGY